MKPFIPPNESGNPSKNLLIKRFTSTKISKRTSRLPHVFRLRLLEGRRFNPPRSQLPTQRNLCSNLIHISFFFPYPPCSTGAPNPRPTDPRRQTHQLLRSKLPRQRSLRRSWLSFASKRSSNFSVQTRRSRLSQRASMILASSFPIAESFVCA